MRFSAIVCASSGAVVPIRTEAQRRPDSNGSAKEGYSPFGRRPLDRGLAVIKLSSIFNHFELEKEDLMTPRQVKFPFKSRLSLKPLLEFWEGLLAEGKGGMTSLEPIIRQKLENAPELREPIENLAVLENHRELIDLLMSAVFPPAF